MDFFKSCWIYVMIADMYSENQIKRDRRHFMKQNADFQEDISQA